MCTPTPAIFTSRPILSLHAPLPNFPSAGSRHRRAGGARAPFLRSPGPIRNGSLLMQTAFSPEQLADPAMASSEAVIRKCVHCGFCTARSEEHTSELQSLMRTSYAVFCLKKKTLNKYYHILIK